VTVNFSGTWNANLSKSRFLSPPPRTVSVKIEHSDPELQEEIVVTKIDGIEEKVVFKWRRCARMFLVGRIRTRY